jgi:endonuclease/exonuclease/phosphatase family metal-dependent hydrolase
MRWFEVASAAMVFSASVAGGELAAGEAALRVMTFNIRYASAADGENAWDKRKELLLATIRAFDPDLLGTQEVLAEQADFLAEHLAGYTLVGVGRDDGKRRGEFSAILLRIKRFELLASGTFWLSETPEVAGSKSWDSSLPRIATWARLRDRAAGGRELVFLNTHWDHRGDEARTQSGKIIRKWLAENARGAAVVVTGDLNVADSHAGYRSLVDPAGGEPRLADAYRVVHPGEQQDEATFHGFSGRRSGRRIDFILVSRQLDAREAAIDRTSRDGRYPSDHFPVTAVLRYAP